ncbi:MAG: hypothetical protein RL743_1867 [Actinomycetota bacterium]|jgi:cytochrome oxidase assembly protein ShyY1
MVATNRFRPLLRPRMIALHLLVVILVVVMANLSAWQFRRLDDRRAFNDQVRSRASVPAAAISDIANLSPDEAEWRPVIVRGTFRPDDEVIVLNRSQNNTAGVDALTPLDFSIDGRKFVVLVDRGFVPLSAEVPPPATGEVEFLARARKSQQRRLGGLTDPAKGILREVQRIDVARLAEQMKSSEDQTVLPFYVDYLQSTSGADDIVGLVTVANPDLSEGSHLSYAIQWIIFSLCAVGAWVILVRRAIRSRPSA